MIEDCKAVIFDMDGLMIDSESIVIRAIQCAGETMGLQISEELCFHMIGRSSKLVKESLYAEFGDDFPLKEFFLQVQKNATRFVEKNGIALKTGLKELIRTLEDAAVLKAVGTSSSRKNTELKLKKTRLYEHFNTVVCGDEVDHSKPAPDIYLKVARQLKLEPRECVVLEDSEPGIQAASAAGMIPIMVPDLHSPSEKLLPLIHQVFPTLHEVKIYLSKNMKVLQMISE
ncbi:MAG: HAD family phosphatase [SAR324 cluster bacterium]|nr:HAD family phosphatase [SAR324 cluster bacterium]